jgi:hypothetical protein
MLVLLTFASSGCFGLVDIGQRGDIVFFKNETYVNARYPLDERLGGHRGWSGRFGEVKILTPTGI